jgi:hypothetical protein
VKFVGMPITIGIAPVKFIDKPITIGYTILSEPRHVLILCVVVLLASCLLGASGSRHCIVFTAPPHSQRRGSPTRSAAARPPIDRYICAEVL